MASFIVGGGFSAKFFAETPFSKPNGHLEKDNWCAEPSGPLAQAQRLGHGPNAPFATPTHLFLLELQNNHWHPSKHYLSPYTPFIIQFEYDRQIETYVSLVNSFVASLIILCCMNIYHLHQRFCNFFIFFFSIQSMISSFWTNFIKVSRFYM